MTAADHGVNLPVAGAVGPHVAANPGGAGRRHLLTGEPAGSPLRRPVLPQLRLDKRPQRQPQLRRNSRLTVEGETPSETPMPRIESPLFFNA